MMAAARSLSAAASFGPDNPHLGGMDGDYLYHLGLTKDDAPAFADVKFFCTGGSAHRMGEFAQYVADELSAENLADVPFGLTPTPIAKTDRFSTYKVGPVLISNHRSQCPARPGLNAQPWHHVRLPASHLGASCPKRV